MLLNEKIKKKKIKFKNNSEYLIPKVVKNNSVLNFNVSCIDIEILGNLSYLNIYYNVMSKNTKNYLGSLLKTEDNLFSCDYCMLDNNLYYCCKYLIAFSKCSILSLNNPSAKLQSLQSNPLTFPVV